MHKPVTEEEIAAVLCGPKSWITAELIRKTLKVWQPHYQERLSAEAAFEILTNTGRIFEVLTERPKSQPDRSHRDLQEEHRAQGEANLAALNARLAHMEKQRPRSAKKRR